MKPTKSLFEDIGLKFVSANCVFLLAYELNKVILYVAYMMLQIVVLLKFRNMLLSNETHQINCKTFFIVLDPQVELLYNYCDE